MYRLLFIIAPGDDSDAAKANAERFLDDSLIDEGRFDFYEGPHERWPEYSDFADGIRTDDPRSKKMFAGIIGDTRKTMCEKLDSLNRQMRDNVNGEQLMMYLKHIADDVNIPIWDSMGSAPFGILDEKTLDRVLAADRHLWVFAIAAHY